MPEPTCEWERDMRSLLGKWVTVTLSREPKLISQVGELRGFTDEGDIMIVDETGCTFWGWPNLGCVETERPGG